MGETDHIDELLAMLDSDDPEDRLTAIRALGDIGDHDTLKLLRTRLGLVNKEFGALVVSVGKLKKKLGVK